MSAAFFTRSICCPPLVTSDRFTGMLIASMPHMDSWRVISDGCSLKSAYARIIVGRPYCCAFSTICRKSGSIP